MGNGEAKELICMTCGHKLRWGMMVGGWYGAKGIKGEKWENCNSIMNKIYFKENNRHSFHLFFSGAVSGARYEHKNLPYYITI